ncbi:MAG: serpin family protein [Pseudomonadota bacterium]|nr:serpin family protein [Pseudomonadota bacterium]
MRTPILLLPTLALALSACEPAGPVDGTPAEVEPPGERVASSKARETSPAADEADVAALTAGNRAFAMDMYHQVAEPGQNLFFSPHSISVALAMTYAGAEGVTETEMADVLGFTLPEETTHAAFNALDLALSSRADLPAEEAGDGFVLSLVNQAFGQTGYPFEAPFLDVLATNYGAAVYLLDFSADPEGSRTAINGWVEEVTNERIVDLLPAGSITDLTRLVLANAIYFKASWSVPFSAEDTVDADFTLLDGSVASVPTMNGTLDSSCAIGAGWTAATLPYVGSQLDMVILVPDAGAFETVEASLDGPALDAVLGALDTCALTVALPKLTVRTDAALVPPLKALGMVDAFDPNAADFSGMSTTSDLYVTGVFHQAFVAIDEKGTEAAAATAVVIGEESAPMPVTLDVDRPFLFAVRDRPTGAVLFLGRVLDPR